MVNRGLLCALLAVGIIGGLLGCSPREQESEGVSLRVALVAPYVSDEAVENIEAYLKEGLPEYNDDDRSFEVTGISAGDSAADPMSVMAGSTRIAATLASGDIDLWICDPENARRYAEDGSNYVALDELFSADEISSLGGTPIAIPITDDEGNATGEFSEIVGLDLSMIAAISEMTGIRDPQMFVLAGSTNREAAKAAFGYLAR